MCIVSYAINFLLLFYAWVIRRRFGKNGLIADLILDIRFLWLKKRPQIMLLALVFGAVFIVMVTKFPAYWNLTPPPLSESISTGVTEDGHPWIGAVTPVIEITEFTDYQCFQCKKMHFFLRRLIETHSDKIRLVHRHYPMDHTVNPIVKEPFHVGSAAMSLLAIYAQSIGKFWEMNDILFNTDLAAEAINTKTLLKQAGVDTGGKAPDIYDPRIQIKLLTDVREGMKLGISGTPAYIIDGKLSLGQIPPDILEKIMKD
jgi:protein-disulfide isomerase